MSRVEHRIERDMRLIADRATPSPDAWNSILTRIADRGPDTETEIIMLTEAPTPTPTPTPNRRWLLLAAAAVVVLVVAAIALASSGDNDDQSPPPTAVATVAQPETLAPTTAAVASGTETVRMTVTGTDIPVTFSMPDDWTLSSDAQMAYKGTGSGEVGVHFTLVPNIYTDGCQWEPADPPVGPTVDDLAAAWANLTDYAATTAVDVTVDGYAGKQVEFTLPDYTIDECRGADSPAFGLWTAPDHSFPGFEAQGSSQHTQQRILDVNGTRLVITAYDVPSTSPQDRSALEEVLASIQIR